MMYPRVTESLDFTDFGNIIDGNVVKTQQVRFTTNPSTGEPLYDAPVSVSSDVEDAISAAHRAFPSWSKTSMDERKDLLKEYAAAIEHYTTGLSDLLTREQGKPLKFARLEIQSTTRWIMELIKQDLPKMVAYDNEEKYVETHYIPLGVVCGILPWNFPLRLAISKIAPALLTGNCIIIKPSPFTPYSTIKLVEIAQLIFPPGVLQIVSGEDDLGPMLTAHPGIDKITFTGSTATGKKIMESASKTLKKVTLELGGNDPAIVLPDVDVSKVAPQIANFVFLNSGQICFAIKRVYVHEDIYPQFLDAMVAYTKTLKVGDGLSEDVFMGPVQNRPQYERVNDIIADGKRNNQKFVLGGGDISGDKGYFICPTIVDNPPDESRVVVEEQFGPIIPLMTWRDEAEVIARANASDMGLGASVWGKDVEHACRIGDQLEAGTVWINQHVAVDAHVPFAGHKNSGLGTENGIIGLAEYCKVQSVFINRKANV